MSDDGLKFFALFIAGADRQKHNITDTPALSNIAFRSSFTAGSGATLALTNNVDLISAAEIARQKFAHLSGPGSLLERTLASTTVTVSEVADVGDTHFRGDGSGDDGAIGDRGPASMSLDVDPTTPDHSVLSRVRTHQVFQNPQERRSLGVELTRLSHVAAHVRTLMYGSAMAAQQRRPRRPRARQLHPLDRHHGQSLMVIGDREHRRF